MHLEFYSDSGERYFTVIAKINASDATLTDIAMIDAYGKRRPPSQKRVWKRAKLIEKEEDWMVR